MKLLLVAAVLSSSTAFAQNYSQFDCKIQQPCQYSRSGLGYCVGHTSLHLNDRSSDDNVISHLVVGKDMGHRTELFQIAADIPVTFQKSSRSFIGQTETGDDWTELRASADKRTLAGKMTIEQDFEFDLNCTRSR